MPEKRTPGSPAPDLEGVDLTRDHWRAIARGLHTYLLQTDRRQKDLADAAGMAVSNLSAYLNLHRRPSLRTIRRIVAAAIDSQGVTPAMVEHWLQQPDEADRDLAERLSRLAAGGLELSDAETENMLAASADDRILGSGILKIADELRVVRMRAAQLAMAHTDAARESLVQSAVEAFQVDPQMHSFMREVEKDVRHAHQEERKNHSTPREALEAMLAREGVKIEQVDPMSPRSGRGRWEGLRWLLSLRHTKRASISTRIHPSQYPFELGRVAGHLRMAALFGGDGQEKVGSFARRWVDENFPQAASDTTAREQLEQDIVWLIFRYLSGCWATGFFTLPAERFVRLAESCEYDVDRLAAALDVSWETVANRISQMTSGLPVHFIKMDWRGVILKRSSLSGLQFAPLYMRVCGRWASARSLLSPPGSIFRQHGTFPDLGGETFFCVARAERAPTTHFRAAPLVYSLTLGVRGQDAQRLVYARNFTTPRVECGVTCRLCGVLNCENRVTPSASQPGIGKFDFSVVWAGKTIHERFPRETST